MKPGPSRNVQSWIAMSDLAEGGSCAQRSVVSHGQDREEADDADGDEGGFDEASSDVAQGARFALPLEDREEHHGGADVGDDEEHFEERPESHAVVRARAGTGDVAGLVEHRTVENELRGDRGDEGDHEEPAGERRRSPIRVDSRRGRRGRAVRASAAFAWRDGAAGVSGDLSSTLDLEVDVLSRSGSERSDQAPANGTAQGVMPRRIRCS